MYKYIQYLILPAIVIVSLLSFNGCEIIKGPNFSEVPKISPKTPKVYYNIIESKLGNRVDSVVLIIKFQDGDGDLGLTSEDRENDPRFKRFLSDGVTPNRYYYNYFVKVFRKSNGEFTEAYTDVLYSGAFPPLKPDGKPGPIEGDLEYGILFPLFSSPPNDTLRFEIQIADKKLNESNIVTTEEIVINPK